jgi:hypothetical protein
MARATPMSRLLSHVGLLTALVCASPGLAQPPPGAAAPPEPKQPSVTAKEVEPPVPSRGPFLAMPSDATLVGEIKPFTHHTDDRTFQSSWSYRDVVRFYDDDFRNRGVHVLGRSVAPEGITFRVRGPDGKVETVIVRNTTPTTIETREPMQAVR